MKSTEEVKSMLDGVRVVCPECGKTPAKCTCVTMDNGFAKKELECCHGTGSVTMHVETGYVVDTIYRNADKAASVRPAYIPLVFVGGNKAGGSTVRTTGWLQEALPGDGTAPGHETSAPGGFWTKVKQCLSRFWN
jgi:hypothetical protein